MQSYSSPPAYSDIPHSQTNPIDLTLDDDDDDDSSSNERMVKRTCPNSRSFMAACTPSSSYQSYSRPPYHSGLSPAMSSSSLQPEQPPVLPSPSPQPFYGHMPQPQHVHNLVQPRFVGPSTSSAFFLNQPPSSPPQHTHAPPQPNHPYTPPTPSFPHHNQHLNPHPNANSHFRQVIDLTNSPSPPPPPPLFLRNHIPPDLSPRTPVCIGQLLVTALVLYPVKYIEFRPPPPRQDNNGYNQNGCHPSFDRPSEDDDMSPDTIKCPPSGIEWNWVTVRFSYENKPDAQPTVNIRPPYMSIPDPQHNNPEHFAVIEQKVAQHLGPLLARGLIRLDGKIQRMRQTDNLVPILSLQLLVFTPKGNIPAVGGYLQTHGLMLDHPMFMSDFQRLQSMHYYNPHSPPPGGHNYTPTMVVGPGNPRWGKSVEVQRNQVNAVFKDLEEGDELAEADPPPEVVTTLYPHQLKAVTFLLERERECLGPDGNYPTLWQERVNPISGQRSWVHVVTQREALEEPVESKGAILADDMGLGKTITCVALMASTLASAREYSERPLTHLQPPSDPPSAESALTPAHFSGSVWGMPEQTKAPPPMSAKAKAKAQREFDRADAEYARACRIKANSRATLIICPLSTVSNWEDQFKEHWRGEVTVVGGASGVSCAAAAAAASSSASSQSPSASASWTQLLLNGTPMPEAEVKTEVKTEVKQEAASSSGRVREGPPLRVYVYHGNSRRPDPAFLADFDAVITTYSTLATEYSKQVKSIMPVEEDEGDGGSSDDCVETDEQGNLIGKAPKPKKSGVKKRKKTMCPNINGSSEATSPLQSVSWFRVVLDEAHSIKETSTVACRACCDLVADRRLCLTGTPVQNKLDDVYALIKFLRMAPFDDKSTWTEFIGTPVKYAQPLGTARLKTIMGCITLRRTKESRANGEKILTLPQRTDHLLELKFSEEEQKFYDRFFTESRAEFSEMSNRNEVMKNYVGILQKILRLRQICDHLDLVRDKGLGLFGDNQYQLPASYEDLATVITNEGLNCTRANAVFALLREAGTAQCVECSYELGLPSDTASDGFTGDAELSAGQGKRRGKPKTPASRTSTRQNSPTGAQIVLTRCQHLFCIACFRGSCFPKWPQVPSDQRRACSVCQTCLSPGDAVEVVPECPLVETKKKNGKREKRVKVPGRACASTKIRTLVESLRELSFANPHSDNFVKGEDEMQLVVTPKVTKSVVFSQWTSMLDKVEEALDEAKIKYDRLDGTMKRDERSRAMDALKYDPACEVLLVSLKAGGVGLNLTAAERVYLLDPYWNPAVENQAIDRIHRLGQTKAVNTYKFIISDSIEARLLEVQKKKTELANMTVGQGFSKSEALKTKMEELNQLFGLGAVSASH